MTTRRITLESSPFRNLILIRTQKIQLQKIAVGSGHLLRTTHPSISTQCTVWMYSNKEEMARARRRACAPMSGHLCLTAFRELRNPKEKKSLDVDG